MSSFKPNKHHLREVILHHYIAKKNPTETYRLLVNVYGKYAPSDETCRRWFVQFKKNQFDLVNKERGKPPKKFEDEELQLLLDKNPCQTQQEMATALGVSQRCISQRLTAMGIIKNMEIGCIKPNKIK